MGKVSIGQIKVTNDFLPTGEAFVAADIVEGTEYLSQYLKVNMGEVRFIKEGLNDTMIVPEVYIEVSYYLKTNASEILTCAKSLNDSGSNDEITKFNNSLRGRINPAVKFIPSISDRGDGSSDLNVDFLVNNVNALTVCAGTVNTTSNNISIEDVEVHLHEVKSALKPSGALSSLLGSGGADNTAMTDYAATAGRANTAGRADTSDTALRIKAEACIQDPETALPMIVNGGIYCVNARVRRTETDDFYNVNFLVSVPNQWDGSYLASTVSMIRVGDAPKAISRVFLELKNGTIDRCMYVNETFDSVNVANKYVIESCRRIEMVY